MPLISPGLTRQPPVDLPQQCESEGNSTESCFLMKFTQVRSKVPCKPSILRSFYLRNKAMGLRAKIRTSSQPAHRARLSVGLPVTLHTSCPDPLPASHRPFSRFCGIRLRRQCVPARTSSPGHCNRQARPHPADECYGAASASFPTVSQTGFDKH